MSQYPAIKALSHWQEHSPVATSTKGRVSIRTLAMIRAIGNAQRIDYEAACKELFGCEPHELYWAAAGSFIEWLKAQPHFASTRYLLSLCPSCQFIQMQDGENLRCNNGHVFELVHRPLNAEEVSAA